MAMLSIIAHHFKISLNELFPVRNIYLILLPCTIFGCIVRYIAFDSSLIRLVISAVVYAVLFIVWAYVVKINYKDIVSPFIEAFSSKLGNLLKLKIS